MRTTTKRSRCSSASVNINSGTQNFAGVRAGRRAVRAEFDALGFKTAWVDGAPFKRAGHLVAERPGTGPRILLIGHLDTVFEPDSPFQKFERVEPTRRARARHHRHEGRRRRSCSWRCRRWQRRGARRRMNVAVVMTGDEEDAGEPQAPRARRWSRPRKGAAVAIGFEDGAGDPRTAVIARRGTTAWTLHVKGTPAHSSQIFREDIGYGAMFEAARILNAFREKLAGEPHLTFNPGAIVGGTQVEFDTRAGPRARRSARTTSSPSTPWCRATCARCRSEQFASARRSHAGDRRRRRCRTTLAEITFDDGYPPLAPTAGNRRCWRCTTRRAATSVPVPSTAVDPDTAGAADVSFVAEHVPMILDGIGLMGDGGHTVNETADLRTLPSQTKRAALLLYRLTRGQ